MNSQFSVSGSQNAFAGPSDKDGKRKRQKEVSMKHLRGSKAEQSF